MSNNFLQSAKDLRKPEFLSKINSPDLKTRNTLNHGSFFTPSGSNKMMVKTPDNNSRKESHGRDGSINLREMQGKLYSIRERMKSTGGSRFRNTFTDTHIQGGFQTGFVQASQSGI